jgi:hypothetical protein
MRVAKGMMPTRLKTKTPTVKTLKAKKLKTKAPKVDIEGGPFFEKELVD